MKKEHFDFYKNILDKNLFCTLSTSSESGKPESAVMGFFPKENGEIYFYCLSQARKYNNIKTNPLASVVIFSQEDYIQMDGEIRWLSNEESEIIKNKFIEKYKEINYQADPDSRYFIFSPKWIRMRISPNYPAEYIETTDFSIEI